MLQAVDSVKSEFCHNSLFYCHKTRKKAEISTSIQAWKKIVQNNKSGDTGKYVGEIY